MNIIDAIVQLRDDILKWVATKLKTKVDMEEGKGLSSNDYTTPEKTKLSGIEEGANKTEVDEFLNSSSTKPIQNQAVKKALDNKVDKVDGSRLITSDEAAKLDALTISGGNLEISGSVNAANVSELESYLDNWVKNSTDPSYGDDTETETRYSEQLRTALDNKANTNDDRFHTHENAETLDDIVGIDTSVSSGSANLITSGAVYTAVQDVVEIIDELTAADVGALPDTTVIPSIDGLATVEYVDAEIDEIAQSLTSSTTNILSVVLPSDRMLGDVSGEGKIDSLDAALIEKYISDNAEFTDVQLWAADVNQDGIVDETDRTISLSHHVGREEIAKLTYYEHWIYDTSIGKYYYDIPISGMTNAYTAIVQSQHSFIAGDSIAGQCITDALRIFANVCPSDDVACNIVYSLGDGPVAFVSTSQDGLATETYVDTEISEVHDEISQELASNRVAVVNATILADRMLGDANGDGVIDADDCTQILYYATSLDDTTDIDKWVSNVDDNEELTTDDAIYLQYHLSFGNEDYPIANTTYYGNWSYNADAQCYSHDISIADMTTAHSAIVISTSHWINNSDLHAECVNGALRLYSTRCPIVDVPCIIVYYHGDGSAYIQKNTNTAGNTQHPIYWDNGAAKECTSINLPIADDLTVLGDYIFIGDDEDEGVEMRVFGTASQPKLRLRGMAESAAVRLQGVDTPYDSTDAANKHYVDSHTFSGEYSDLSGSPEITTEDGESLTVMDSDSNVVLRVNEDGLETTKIMAGTIVVNGVDVESKLNEFAPAYLYGTEDLVAGESTLASGVLYFVYE